MRLIQGCPLSPYLFIIVLSSLTQDLNDIFLTLFDYTPWTFSSQSPSTDIEYADDTVLRSEKKNGHSPIMTIYDNDNDKLSYV